MWYLYIILIFASINSLLDSWFINIPVGNEIGILLTRTESQGFAIQDMMARNLPLFVWNMKINEYEGYHLSGSSVSMWSENCGKIVNNEKEFEENFDIFLNDLDKYSPEDFVKAELTYEKFEENLLKIFSSF